jgi:hypothetical protein
MLRACGSVADAAGDAPCKGDKFAWLRCDVADFGVREGTMHANAPIFDGHHHLRFRQHRSETGVAGSDAQTEN